MGREGRLVAGGSIMYASLHAFFCFYFTDSFGRGLVSLYRVHKLSGAEESHR